MKPAELIDLILAFFCIFFIIGFIILVCLFLFFYFVGIDVPASLVFGLTICGVIFLALWQYLHRGKDEDSIFTRQ